MGGNTRKVSGMVVALVAAAGVAVPVTIAEAASCPAPIPAVAHRGGIERYVENTRGAFRYATTIGANVWELDVRFDLADAPFVIHDETLDRTTNRTGAVATQDLSAARAAGLRTDDGQTVPTLYEVATDAAARGARLLAEIKVDPTPAQLSRFLARLDWTGMRARTVVTSFDRAVITKIRRAAPDLQTAWIDELGDRQTSEITPYGGSYVKHYWSITSARMAKWSPPLHVYAWTPDQPADWQRMNTYRLAGVITGRPAAYYAWARARRC